jgi:pyruvate formate lyase activating enzyme
MSSPTAIIVNVQRFSTEDGPGIRTTVFFKGCPMRCPWCHNPETLRFEPEVVWHRGRCLGDGGCIGVCPQNALSMTPQGLSINRPECRGCGTCVEYCPSEALEIHGRSISVPALFEQVARDATFYQTSGGGVTLSGGEPLAQPESAVPLLRLLHDAGIHTALDTCGAVAERALRDALEATDLVLFDIKSVDPVKHEALTGVPFHRVAASAKLVNESGVPVWVRTPIIPGCTDDEKGLRAIARFVSETLAHCKRHDLLAFSNLCTSKYEQLGRSFPVVNAPLVPCERMQRLREMVENEGSRNVHWSGPTRLDEATV